MNSGSCCNFLPSEDNQLKIKGFFSNQRVSQDVLDLNSKFLMCTDRMRIVLNQLLELTDMHEDIMKQLIISENKL